MDIVAGDLRRPPAEHARRRRIDECRPSGQIDTEHALRSGVENQLVLFAEPRQLVRLLLDRLAFAKQLDEHPDLGAEHVGIERFEDVVDRP